MPAVVLSDQIWVCHKWVMITGFPVSILVAPFGFLLPGVLWESGFLLVYYLPHTTANVSPYYLYPKCYWLPSSSYSRWILFLLLPHRVQLRLKSNAWPPLVARRNIYRYKVNFDIIEILLRKPFWSYCYMMLRLLWLPLVAQGVWLACSHLRDQTSPDGKGATAQLLKPL